VVIATIACGLLVYVSVRFLRNPVAATIVAYREKAQRDHPGKTVFTSVYSLSVIRGIGPARLETLRAYLIFPPKPATASSTR